MLTLGALIAVVVASVVAHGIPVTPPMGNWEIVGNWGQVFQSNIKPHH